MSVNLGAAIGYLDLDTSKFKKGFKSAYDDLQIFQNKSATTSQKLSGLSSAMGSMGSTLTRSVTLPIVGIGAAMVKTTADFEAGMSEVGAISGASGEDLEALANKAKEMGATTKFSATESAEALKYMAMAGWDTQKMLDGLPGVMNLAAASGEELGIVSDIVTDALTAFGMKAEEAGHFSDVLAAASSNANTNVSMLGESFKYAAPIAGAMGYSCEDTAIALGLMANAGIKASQGGTSLRGALTRLASPTDQVAKAMGDLGIEIANQDGSMKPLSETMDILRDKMGGLTEEQQIQYASTIFGKNAMSGMLAIINASEEDYQKLTNAIYDCDGASQEMSEKMLDNLTGQMTLLKSALEGLSIAFGEIMLPAVKAVVKGVQGLVDFLNNTTEDTKKFILVVTTIATALGPAILIFGKLITLGLKIKTAFGLISKILLPLKLSFMMLGSPIALIQTALQVLVGKLAILASPVGIAIAAIVAFAVAIKNNTLGIRDTISNLFTAIGDLFQSFIDFIGMLVDAFKSMWDNNFLGIRTIVQSAFEFIINIVNTALQVLTGIITIFSGILKGDWSQVWEGIKQVASAIWEGIKQGFKSFLDIIIGILTGIGSALWGAAKAAFGKIWDGFKEKWDATNAWFREFSKDPVGTLKKTMGPMYLAAKAVFLKIKAGFYEKWNAIKAWFEKAKNDPVGTIRSIGGSLKKAASSAFSKMWQGFKSKWESIKSWFEGIAEWIRNKIDEIARKGQNLKSGAAAGIEGVQRGAPKQKSAPAKVGEYATGLSYVPYDGFPAILHKGERVLTAKEASAYNQGEGGSYNFNFYSPQQLSPAEEARRFKKEMNKLLFNM